MSKSGLLLILMMAYFSVLICMPRTHIVKASPIFFYIRVDGTVDPSTAPIQRDGDTYTLTVDVVSNYSQVFRGIIVERDNIVLDGANHKFQGVSPAITISYSAIDISRRSNVTIKNFEISQYYSGVLLNESSGNSICQNEMKSVALGIWLFSFCNNNTVSENNMTDNEWGIDLCDSSNNSIYGNDITDSGSGIRLRYSSNNNIISANNLTNCDFGIGLEDSFGNVLRTNSMIGNACAFHIGFFSIPDYLTPNDVDVSNTVDSRPVYCWIGEHNKQVPLDAGYVSLVNCSGITVQNLNLIGNGQGVLLVYTTNSTITHNNITNNRDGIRLFFSSGNIICENTMLSSGEGILLEFSDNNTVIRNNVTAGIGILVGGSNCNRILDNSLTASNRVGIYIECSSANDISGNNVIGSNYSGIDLRSSNDNIITNNNLTKNGCGISFSDSSDNRICSNNFLDNIDQAHFYYNSINTWDDGSKGNYWSDYQTKYPDAAQIDGIWNTPYEVAANNVDHRPLTNPIIIPEFPLLFLILPLLAVEVLTVKVWQKTRT